MWLEFFTSASTPVQGVLLYLALINIVAFVAFWLDKMKSQLRHRRIPEKTLWLLTLFGGTAGALLSMHLFRHKTKKHSFQAVMVLILLIQIGAVVLWFGEDLFVY